MKTPYGRLWKNIMLSRYAINVTTHGIPEIIKDLMKQIDMKTKNKVEGSTNNPRVPNELYTEFL